MRASILDNLIWGMLLLLLVPSGLAVASWNSLPGSMLYKTKLTMEQGLVAIMPSYEAKGSLQVTFTERRAADATRMLADKASVEGLTYLNDQMATTKRAIQNAPNAQVKKELAQKYIATLQNVNTQLEEQKQVYAANNNPSTSGDQSAPAPTRTPTHMPTPRPTNKPAQPTQAASATHTPTPVPTAVPTQAPQDEGSGDSVTEEIGNTQDEIEETIDELEELSQASSVDPGTPGQVSEQEKDREKEREKDREKDNNGDKGNDRDRGHDR